MKISVLTPCFNSAQYLNKSIESVLSQTYQNWEHIIFYWRTKQGSEIDVVMEKAGELIGVELKYLRRAMNKAFKMCTGDLIIYLNADDYFFDNSFQVFIIPAGESDLGESIFLADQVENISISWESKKNLIISYDKARIFQFRNFWQSSEVDNFQTTISIVERSNKL